MPLDDETAKREFANSVLSKVLGGTRCTLFGLAFGLLCGSFWLTEHESVHGQVRKRMRNQVYGIFIDSIRRNCSKFSLTPLLAV